MTLRIPLITLGLLIASTALAEDWPIFRGPNRDGLCKETGLLQSWPKEGPPQVWTAKNLGSGFSTPTIAKGQIFGMGTRQGKDGVWALKEADGSELWFTPFDETVKRNPNTGPSSSPTYDDGSVYAVSTTGKLVKLDATSGKVAWQKSYADFGGKVPQWGFTDSPLIDGDKLIVIPTADKAVVVALDKKTGKELWKTVLASGVGRGAGYTSAIKATIAETPMYVVLTGDAGGLIGISPETGKVLWQYTGLAARGSTAQIPIPVISQNNIWVSSSYRGGAALIEIVPDGNDKFTVKEIKSYRKPELNNHHGGMVQAGDYVYFGHDQNAGSPVCVDLKTGEIKWGPEKPPTAGGVPRGAGSAAVLAADGRLYFRYEKTHELFLIEPSPEGFKVISSFKEPEPSGKESWAHPVIANGKLYLRDQDKMHCFNVKADKN